LLIVNSGGQNERDDRRGSEAVKSIGLRPTCDVKRDGETVVFQFEPDKSPGFGQTEPRAICPVTGFDRFDQPKNKTLTSSKSLKKQAFRHNEHSGMVFRLSRSRRRPIDVRLLTVDI
jgi:hypothetical protein